MSFGTKNLACPIKGGIMSIMSMGGEGGGGLENLSGGHIFSRTSKGGHVFSRFSKACDTR